MQFLKKHYEKIVLGIVLAGLIGGLIAMVFYISADRQAMDDASTGLINPPVKPLPELDLSTNSATAARLGASLNLDLENQNKVFNPFEWQKTADGRLVKKATSIAQVATVTNISPLYTLLSLDSVTTNEFGARYLVVVQKQAAATAAKRAPQRRYISVGDKANDTFALLEVKGQPENPDALILKLVDTGETVSISRTQPYRRVDGYISDFRYDPEKKVFRAKRNGDRISFGGTDYLVFEVNQNELILTDLSNQKKTSLPFNP